MNLNKLATENYKRFCGFEGSEYIASPFAIAKVLSLIQTFQTTEILEVGMGIGSFADTILKAAQIKNWNVKYIGTENNDFCLTALKKNVKYYDSVRLFSDLGEIEKRKFNLILIDGLDTNLLKLQEITQPNAIIFIEGGRLIQLKSVLELFPSAIHVNCITLEKTPLHAHGDTSNRRYLGGGQLIFIKPTFKMKLFWCIEKVKTFLIRKLRTY